jgi:hypothetical protein
MHTHAWLRGFVPWCVQLRMLKRLWLSGARSSLLHRRVQSAAVPCVHVQLSNTGYGAHRAECAVLPVRSLTVPRPYSLALLRPLSSRSTGSPHGRGSESESSALYRDQNDTFVDRYAPASMKPYLKLIRIDRPIGASAQVARQCRAVPIQAFPPCVFGRSCIVCVCARVLYTRDDAVTLALLVEYSSSWTNRRVARHRLDDRVRCVCCVTRAVMRLSVSLNTYPHVNLFALAHVHTHTCACLC